MRVVVDSHIMVAHHHRGISSPWSQTNAHICRATYVREQKNKRENKRWSLNKKTRQGTYRGGIIPSVVAKGNKNTEKTGSK